MSETSTTPGPGGELGYRPCVGIMVINTTGRVWIGRRADAPGEPEGRGTWWQMPQGGIDDQEDPGQAALRELREETGITTVEVLGEHPGWLTYDLPPALLGRAWGGRYRGQTQRWYAVRFMGEDDEIDIGPPAGHKPEFDAWRWARLDETMDLIVPFKRAVYASIIAELGHFARPG